MLDFTNCPSLVDFYKDNSDRIVCQKAARTGYSEALIVDLFNLAKQGKNLMYILPNQTVRNLFVADRIDRLVQCSPLYRSNVGVHEKDVHAKGMKTIFGSTVAFTGSESDKPFYAFDADALFVDEYDACDQDNLIIARDRTGAAKDESGRAKEITRFIGNPSIEGFGINAEYEASDAKVWHIWCQHCGEAQPITWFDNVVEQIGPSSFRLRDESFSDDSDEDIGIICRHCSKPIDRLSAGEWVAQHPGNPISGYQVNQIFGDVRLGRVIWDKYQVFLRALSNPTELQHFYNKRLGLPYAAHGAKLVDALLEECVDHEWKMPLIASGTAGGVDINLGLHTVIYKPDQGRNRLVWAGQCVDYYDLDSKCKQYGVVCGVMDAGPEIHAPREFVRSHMGWYVCRYNLTDKMKTERKMAYPDMAVDYVGRSISVNRTESLDGQLSDHLNGVVIYPPDFRFIDGGNFAKQMTMPTRIQETRPDKTLRYVWTKGVDHYFHASNYARMAARMLGGLILIRADA